MSDFHKRLPELILRAGLTPAELSRRIGSKPGYISNMLQDQSDVKLSTLQAISNELRCSMDELTCMGPLYSVKAMGDPDAIATRVAEVFHRTINEEMSRLSSLNYDTLLEDFIDFWLEQGGRLSGDNRFSDFVDVYQAPKDDRSKVRLEKMGPRSASAMTFGMTTTDQLNAELSLLPAGVHADLASAQRRTLLTKRPLYTIERLTVNTSVGPIDAIYKRVYSPWWENGREYVINLSKRVDVKVGNPKLFREVSKPALLGSD